MRHRRRTIRKKISNRQFKRVARRVHKKNLSGRIMRGGVRL